MTTHTNSVTTTKKTNYRSVNPSDGTSTKTFATLTATEVDESIAIADACFKTWKATTYAHRAKIVSGAATLLRQNVDELAKLATLEMGKRFTEAQGEVEFSASIMDYYATNSEAFLQPVSLHPAAGEGLMESSPLGVLFCVEPWNFPFYQLARVAGPQLMAGNTLVVKHAGSVPQCAIAFEKLIRDAGAPLGAYTNLFLTHDQSDGVIDDPRIKGVALTGGIGAGRSIAARAGQNLKKSTMELGGNDAFIVLDDADLERTIPWAVWGRMYNAGQTCCAAKRFIAVESIADEFLEKFIAALKELCIGDPMLDTTTLGPLSSEGALVQLLSQVDSAIAHGAKVLLGGKRVDRPGSFMEATVLTDISPDNPAFREEFFGPVASFYRVKDEEAAIALANCSDFGLGGSVFTADVARGKSVASRIDTGMMFVNGIDWSDAELPFGGIKQSGYGRELGKMGIQEFVNWKLVRTSDVDAPR